MDFYCLLNLIRITSYNVCYTKLLRYILYEAIKLARQAMYDVLDTQLPEDLRNKIEQAIEVHGGDMLSCHNLRTRKSGSRKIIDFHLTVCKNLTVDESHRITELLEEQISYNFV